MTRRIATLCFLFIALAAIGAAAPQSLAGGGASLDVSRFAYTRRLLNVRKGLNIVTLDAAALAHSRIADLRIVDASGKQVPYVVERKTTRLEMPLPLPVLLEGSTPQESRYSLRLPFGTLPESAIELSTTAGVFERTLSIETNRDRTKKTIASATWRSVSGSPAPVEIALPPNAGRDFVLVVDEGDNSRLPLRDAKLLTQTRSIRFFAVDPRLRLVYGNRSLGSPRYDMALLGSEVDSSAANVVRLAPESSSSHGRGGEVGERTFWIALVVAVVLLLLLLARLIAADRERPVEP